MAPRLQHAGTAASLGCSLLRLTDSANESRVAIACTQPAYEATSPGGGCEGVSGALSLLVRDDGSHPAKVDLLGDTVKPGDTVVPKPDATMSTADVALAIELPSPAGSTKRGRS